MAGDAARHSSQGILNALFTGLAAVEGADAHLRGDEEAMCRYGETISGIATVYRRHLMLWYDRSSAGPNRRSGNAAINASRLLVLGCRSLVVGGRGRASAHSHRA